MIPNLTLRAIAILTRVPTSTECHVIEVGVGRGRLSYTLLSLRPNLWLTAVDHWRPPAPGSDYAKTGDFAGLTQRDFDAMRKSFNERTAPFSKRVTVLHQDRLEACAAIPPHCADAVFIDAAHDYESVKADIAAYIPKVKAGGWIGGHDYCDNPDFGVKQAVDERFGPCVEPDCGFTWWVRM